MELQMFGQQKSYYLKANPCNRENNRHCKRIGKFAEKLQFSHVSPHLHPQQINKEQKNTLYQRQCQDKGKCLIILGGELISLLRVQK